ncbi:hypothetical protein NEOLI_000697 [Neolecta irregularis DAH-3]|uniref:Uncharacterized protein n=1 Tax=Neolecta irregularis (strain DAH-3) TaxID=1198029 RepID=A0A1U7LWK5_NEOID|nr:hypothetical protein NEOLI_000697 [Neolecta irregularis DAH-3]|eukprot:OLL26891.1 hypothetical protein NEOLI_000697 [Neolecta irregularis DAH-3]
MPVFSSTKSNFLSSFSKKKRGSIFTSKNSPAPESSHSNLLSRDELHKAITALEEVLKSFDQLTEFSLRYGQAAKHHAKNLKGLMGCIKGDDQKMYALVLSSSAGYFDAFAATQEKLTKHMLKQYNSLNIYAEKYFSNLASEEASLEALTINLDSKLKKLATTFHAQGTNAPDSYIYKIQTLSSGINGLRLTHSKKYTNKQREVNAVIANSSAKLALCGYACLSDAIVSCGGTNGIGGVNAYAPFCQRDVIPPLVPPKSQSFLGYEMSEFELGVEHKYYRHDRPPSSFALARRNANEKERKSTAQKPVDLSEIDATSKKVAELIGICRDRKPNLDQYKVI